MKKIILLIALVIMLELGIIGPLAQFAQASGNISQPLAVDQIVSAGGETSYRICVKNDDTQLHKYNLVYDLLPQSFQGQFLQDQKVIKEVDIKAQGSTIINCRVQAPISAAAGSHPIQIAVQRDDGQTFSLPLSLTINRDYALAIINEVKGLQVINGQTLSFQVAVANTGSKKISQAGLQFDLPYKWMVQRISPEKIALKPGENGLLSVQVVVPPSQAAGLSQVKVRAVSGDINSPATVIPVTVQSNNNYFVWVLALLLVAGLSTLFYFRKHGRR